METSAGGSSRLGRAPLDHLNGATKQQKIYEDPQVQHRHPQVQRKQHGDLIALLSADGREVEILEVLMQAALRHYSTTALANTEAMSLLLFFVSRGQSGDSWECKMSCAGVSAATLQRSFLQLQTSCHGLRSTSPSRLLALQDVQDHQRASLQSKCICLVK